MNEVDGQPVDGRRELFEAVEPSLLFAPVVPVAPVGDELLQVANVSAICPPVALQRLWKARLAEPRLEVCEHGVGHVDRERTYRPGVGPLSARRMRNRDQQADEKNLSEHLHTLTYDAAT